MSKIFLIAKRLICEIFADRRTTGLLIMAPLFIITLLSFIFNAPYKTINVGYITSEISNPFVLKQVQENSSDTLNFLEYQTTQQLSSDLQDQKIDGSFAFNQSPEITTSGVAPILDSYVQTQVATVLNPVSSSVNTLNNSFGFNDYLIVFLMQFIIFFFSFLTVGVSFLRERNQGTITRMLTCNLKRIEIVLGYVLGYGFIALLQTTVIELYSIVILDLTITGNIFISILVNSLFSAIAISLGCFLSAFAKNEFQIMQFIPIIIIPQILFSAILPYGDTYNFISHLLPITYGFEVQKQILLLANYQVLPLILIFLLYICFFCIITNLTLKKIRKL